VRVAVEHDLRGSPEPGATPRSREQTPTAKARARRPTRQTPVASAAARRSTHETPAANAGTRRTLPAALRNQQAGITTWIRAIRIRQWPKNLLVFAAPAAAGALSRPGVLGHVALAAVAFCLLSSGAYLFNDLRDAPEDRRHPVKRRRPIASRAIAPTSALVAACGAIAAGLGISAMLGPDSLAIACAYAAVSFSYTAWLRNIAIADIATVAGAFVIRAAAGAIAAGVPISRWLFVVVSFAALFVAAGKRYADYLEPASRGSRRVLAEYNADFLRMVIGTAAAVALGAYCLWAFGTARTGMPAWRVLTTIPFTIGLLRYGLLVTGGRGSAPEEIMLSDRFMQLTGAAWLLTFVLGL
jgi:decaprenyl-phosphate phosphoribosyltransferase